MEITISGLKELPEAARYFLDSLSPETNVIAFHGDMGVGKTTFISALAQELGVTDQEVNSPTFAIVNHYTTPDRDIYHFDLYRLESMEQALEIGAQEYLYSDGLCFIEWPENCPGLLPEDTLHVYICELPDGTRTIKF